MNFLQTTVSNFPFSFNSTIYNQNNSDGRRPRRNVISVQELYVEGLSSVVFELSKGNVPTYQPSGERYLNDPTASVLNNAIDQDDKRTYDLDAPTFVRIEPSQSALMLYWGFRTPNPEYSSDTEATDRTPRTIETTTHFYAIMKDADPEIGRASCRERV